MAIKLSSLQSLMTGVNLFLGGKTGEIQSNLGFREGADFRCTRERNGVRANCGGAETGVQVTEHRERGNGVKYEKESAIHRLFVQGEERSWIKPSHEGAKALGGAPGKSRRGISSARGKE